MPRSLHCVLFDTSSQTFGEETVPTVLRIGPYRFHFYSDERNEPPHIHVRTGDNECKFWLDPIILAKNRGIPAHRLNEIASLVFQNQNFLMEKYHEYHNR